jgi:hypothetical protein
MSFVIIHMVFKNKYFFLYSIFNLYTREAIYFLAQQYKFTVKNFSRSASVGRDRKKFPPAHEPAPVAHDL